MKRKAISRILAISLSVAMCAQSIPIYAAEEIRTSAAADFFAEDSIENQSLNEGDAETNTETNTETNAESNTETNAKADATTGISEAYTLEESNSATTSEETVTDKDGFWSGESETVESSANGSDGWESAEMNGAEAGDEAIKRDAAAFVSGDVEENVEETGETNELEEALSESAEMTEGDFSYVIVNNSYARITRYSGSATSVQVPSTIGGYAVQVIGARAFQGNTVLESVELPDGLTTIYAYAFENCTSITSIHLPDSITTLGYKVFGGCSNLVSANYPVNWVNSPSGNGSNSYEYGNVFSGCPKLTEIEIPEGVKAIAPHSFASLTTLTSVTLPSSLTEIGAYAFAGATGLTEVTFPSNTKTIRDYAFADCAGLKDIYIPDSTTDIRKAVFENCPQLTIHCSYYSMATIYAIENNIPFEQIGTYTDSAETVLDRSDTSYYGDFGSATANGYVAMTVRYNIKDTWKSAVSDLNVKLVLPSNGELDESTLKVDGELCQNYNLKDRTLTIPVSGTSGIIRFSIKAQSQSVARSYAILNYKKNRNSSQEIIGVLNESINLFTIDAPDVVSKPTVNVSGMANAGGTVTLLVNEKEQQTVQVSKAGLWSAVLTLENPSNYETYKIKALCTQADGTTETRTAAVTYNEGEPSIESFKMYYNEHDKIKSYDLTKTDGVTPLVYYLPKSKFDYELTFENPEQIKTLYVTSTRNNQTKYLEATYDPEKNAFVTDGYFDESDHNYVPGVISYEYNKTVPEVKMGQDFDWEALQKGLPEGAEKDITVRKNTATDYDATIDLSKFGEDLKDVGLDVTISVFDESNGSSMGTWKGLIDEANKDMGYLIPGYDDSKYICNLDYSDKGTWYMLVKDVTGNKYIGFMLDTATENAGTLDQYWTLSQISSHLSTINKGASMLYQNYQIEKDILASGGHYSDQELKEKLKAVDNLESDQKMFMIMTAMIPLVVAGGAMGAGPVIALTAILGTITAASSLFWDIRKADIKGEKFKLRFVVDPSGYVFDLSTGERIEDVTVTAYWIPYDESDDFWNKTPSPSEYGTKWNAGEYNQYNPLQTNADGKYAWDVPEGWWRVKYEKEGYETTWSDWMTVPPLRTEVNIGMVSQTKPSVEHSWDNGTVVIAATCTSTGIISYECTDCHITRTEVLPVNPDAHSWDNGNVTKEATCTEEGIRTFTCVNCRQTRTEKLPAKGHGETEVRGKKAATCASEGYTGDTYCKTCGTRLSGGETIAKTEHTWGEWEKTSDATVFAAQKEKRICKICQTTEERDNGNPLTSKMTLTASSLKMKIKQTTKALKISGMESGDYVASVVSGNSKLLKVSSYTKDGAVTLKAQKKTGKTKLTVTLAGGAVKTVNVTIQKGTVKTTKISGVPKKITLKKGKKQTLAPILAPITTQQKVTYTTSNKKVCTVTKSGVITAKKKGTAKVTVRSGSKKVVITVKVS